MPSANLYVLQAIVCECRMPMHQEITWQNGQRCAPTCQPRYVYAVDAQDLAYCTCPSPLIALTFEGFAFIFLFVPSFLLHPAHMTILNVKICLHVTVSASAFLARKLALLSNRLTNNTHIPYSIEYQNTSNSKYASRRANLWRTMQTPEF